MKYENYIAVVTNIGPIHTSTTVYTYKQHYFKIWGKNGRVTVPILIAMHLLY